MSLVLWLWEKTDDQEVVSANPGTGYNVDFSIICCKLCLFVVVVAQLVERSLPIPEVRGSNPVIGKIY